MSRSVPPMKWWQWIALPVGLGLTAYGADLFARMSVPFDREPSLALRASYVAVAVAAGLAIIYWVRRLRPGPGRTLRYRVLPVMCVVIAVLKIPNVFTATSTKAWWFAVGGVALSALCAVVLVAEGRKKGAFAPTEGA